MVPNVPLENAANRSTDDGEGSIVVILKLGPSASLQSWRQARRQDIQTSYGESSCRQGMREPSWGEHSLLIVDVL